MSAGEYWILNDAMRVHLLRAAQEEALTRGRSLNDAQLVAMLQASFKFGPDGFKRKTVWRALELATAALEEPDGGEASE